MAELGELDWAGLAAYLRQMNLVSILCRFVLAAVCGSVIGFERGKKRHAAGLRTHIVVCIGAMSAMLVNQYIITYFNPNSDPAR
ncbi:MgtC/SapB family protein, partial [Yanshouia hominis]